jgi:hypothetical protein
MFHICAPKILCPVRIDSYCTSSSSTLCSSFFVWFLHLHVILFKIIHKPRTSVISVRICYTLFPHLYVTVSYSSVYLIILAFPHSKNYTQVILLLATKETYSALPCCPHMPLISEFPIETCPLIKLQQDTSSFFPQSILHFCVWN